MRAIVPVVEGIGEAAALPILIRKLLVQRNRFDLTVGRPRMAHGRSNLTKPGGLEYFVELALRETQCGGVLVLLDADETKECPVHLADTLAKRLGAVRLLHPVAIVLARREFEAWFLASLESISSYFLGEKAGPSAEISFSEDPEAVRNVKGWLSKHFPGSQSYREVEDQAPMAARLDLALAYRRSRSFRRLSHAIDELLEAIDAGSCRVTPAPLG